MPDDMLRHILVEIDGEMALECEAVSVRIERNCTREVYENYLGSCEGIEMIYPCVRIVAELPADSRKVRAPF